MGKRSLSQLAGQLFEGAMAPLVLGGALAPGAPLGARAAAALAEWAPGADVVDPALCARVDARRVASVRALVPVDALPAADGAVWALFAGLHDLLLATHPSLRGVFRQRTAPRLLDHAEAVIDAVRPPADVVAAVARHGWLARLLEARRIDTEVRSWVSRSAHEGAPPPPRLLLWPRLRRVQVARNTRPLADLADGSAVDPTAFRRVLALLLTRTPLTELATCTRPSPPFAWSPSALGFVATRGGRTLALRALSRLDEAAVDEALGRATRALVQAGEPPLAGPAYGLLGERALGRAERALTPGAAAVDGAPNGDRAFARVAGAVLARRDLTLHPELWPRPLWEGLVRQLDGVMAGPLARQALAAVTTSSRTPPAPAPAPGLPASYR